MAQNTFSGAEQLKTHDFPLWKHNRIRLGLASVVDVGSFGLVRVVRDEKTYSTKSVCCEVRSTLKIINRRPANIIASEIVVRTVHRTAEARKTVYSFVGYNIVRVIIVFTDFKSFRSLSFARHEVEGKTDAFWSAPQRKLLSWNAPKPWNSSFDRKRSLFYNIIRKIIFRIISCCLELCDVTLRFVRIMRPDVFRLGRFPRRIDLEMCILQTILLYTYDTCTSRRVRQRSNVINIPSDKRTSCSRD